tara:strand:- start:51040 stop:51198 length:159 start_codon:yes stop_codon:yes gene_type:complete
VNLHESTHMLQFRPEKVNYHCVNSDYLPATLRALNSQRNWPFTDISHNGYQS